MGEGDVPTEPVVGGPPTAGPNAQNAATIARAAVKEERARVKALEDGEEKEQALEKLAEMEAGAVEAEVRTWSRRTANSRDCLLPTDHMTHHAKEQQRQEDERKAAIQVPTLTHPQFQHTVPKRCYSVIMTRN